MYSKSGSEDHYQKYLVFIELGFSIYESYSLASGRGLKPIPA